MGQLMNIGRQGLDWPCRLAYTHKLRWSSFGLYSGLHEKSFRCHRYLTANARWVNANQPAAAAVGFQFDG